MSKQHFVLVHGSGHGAWCWSKVRSRLEQLGHTVTCIDLAGCGRDLEDVTKIHTFEDYHKPLFDFLSALPDEAQIVLVGHSSGGVAVTRAARAFAAKVAVAVYASAFMMRNGFSTPQDYEMAPDLSEYGDVDELFGDGNLKPEYQRKLLYNLSPQEDATLASMLLRPMAIISDEYIPGRDNVRRVYVKSLQDKIIKQSQQETMIQRWPPSKVYSLDSDHSPFFAVPDQLCDVLLDVFSVGNTTSPLTAIASKGCSYRATKFKVHHDLVQQRQKSLIVLVVLLLLLLLILVLMIFLLGWTAYNSMLRVKSGDYISNGALVQ